MDFATRMKMMSKSKANPRKSIFGIKKEEPDIKEEPGLKKKKKRRKRYSSSEDSEEEEKRITRKAKKKLGLSVCLFRIFLEILPKLLFYKLGF